MKVTFKYGIGSFSGTVDNATYWATARKTGSIMRRWVMPKATSQNTELASIAENLSDIWADVAEGYKSEMKTYCQRYFSEHTNPEDPFASRTSNYAMWVKMMYSFYDANSGTIDLKSITLDDLETLYAGSMASIALQAAAGYLANVTDVADLDFSMWG